MNKTILSTMPLIERYDNFLSNEECDSIIEFAMPKLEIGTIVAQDGTNQIDYAYRTASTTSVGWTEDFPLKDVIYDRVETTFGIDKSRFERMTITHYATGEEFKVHQDYFVELLGPQGMAATAERCKKGGNRVGTFIFYLNDVEAGGETYFPWVNVITAPAKGSVVHFDYGYEDWRQNIRSQHAGMPVLSGMKWIVTIWVRENPLTTITTDYKSFSDESRIFSRIRDIEYELPVGPPDDRKTLSFVLPANTNPMNTIIVGFTGGMDSSLVLYLVAMLNNMQEIPYIIQPVCVTSRICGNAEKIAEDWPNVELMAKLINEKTGGLIRDLIFLSAPVGSPRHLNVREGLMRFFNKSADLDIHRFQKNEYIYMGDNALPPDPDFPGADTVVRYTRKAPLPWMNCLINLYKHHITDALIQLGLEDIIEHTSVCRINHKTLDEPCITFQCNERRWAFTKINNEIGVKYLINKGEDNDNKNNTSTDTTDT